MGKTTRMETVYHGGYPVKVMTSMKDAMEAKRLGAGAPGVLLAPRRAAERHPTTPPLGGPSGRPSAGQRAPACPTMARPSPYVTGPATERGVWAPTIVWMSEPPADAHWQWAQASPALLVTVTTTLPPWPWIAIAPAAVAKFKYPAECVAHRCPGHPNKGPLYYSLGTAGTVPAELGPALRNHLREHHGDLALLAPHGLATDPPQVLAPEVKPGIWFHDLPVLATLRGTVAAVDAGTT